MFERKSLRLKDWDYASPGMYYVTVCTQDRAKRFGRIVDGRIISFNDGIIVNNCWYDIPKHFDHVRVVDFIVMPNHIHGVIEIVRRDGIYAVHEDTNVMGAKGLGEIIRWFKGRSTFECNKLQDGINAVPTRGSIWQARFHDHVIRNDEDLHRIRQYIRDNPAKWHEDEYYT